MAYRIQQFDGLVITDITKLPSGGKNDIGSGDALTSFAQLPGGGFFDNYGAGDSPQGIRPITRNCVLWGDTTAELITNLKALRGKIGRRGRLTVQFDDGSVWWQWARLQKVSTPRPQEAKGNFLPCDLTWISAAQMWYGTVQSGTGWSVGDDSFDLGDGTVGLGMNEYTYALSGEGTRTITPTLPNAGNTDVRNMRIVLATDERIVSLLITCAASGQEILWENPNLTGAFTVTIDTGSKSCYVRMDDEGGSISEIKARGATVVVTQTAHGYATGDSVEITGTDYYDGVHYDITVVDANTYTYTIVDDIHQEKGTVVSGTAYPVDDAWWLLTVYNRKDWFMLAPGDNELSVTHTLNAGIALQDYSVTFYWYDHYK